MSTRLWDKLCAALLQFHCDKERPCDLHLHHNWTQSHVCCLQRLLLQRILTMGKPACSFDRGWLQGQRPHVLLWPTSEACAGLWTASEACAGLQLRTGGGTYNRRCSSCVSGDREGVSAFSAKRQRRGPELGSSRVTQKVPDARKGIALKRS